MGLTISFKDAVDASVLDQNATHAVYYMDGRYQNHDAVRARCPHAKLYAITVRGATGKGIFACDSETFDLDIPSTVRWVAEQVRLGVSPIVVYANRDRWLNLGLLSALAHYGNRIERWDADFDGVPTVPSWASAKQYRSTNVDYNIALANFFGDVAHAQVRQASAEIQVSIPEGTTGTLHFDGVFNASTGHWTIHGAPGNVTFSGPGGGEWRVASLPWNAPPLKG